MSDTKAKKSIGFYILAAAAVIGIISIVLYGSAMNKASSAYVFMGAAIVVAIASLVLGIVTGHKFSNWGAAVAAALMAAGLGWSLTVMVDAIGYVISGLYQFSLLQTYITFAIVAGIAWLLLVIASFTGIVKN